MTSHHHSRTVSFCLYTTATVGTYFNFNHLPPIGQSLRQMYKKETRTRSVFAFYWKLLAPYLIGADSFQQGVQEKKPMMPTQHFPLGSKQETS